MLLWTHLLTNSFKEQWRLLEKWSATVHCQVKRIIPYNDDFDLELYGEAITMATDFPDIFGSTQSNGFGY
ncbi:hypothetical protein OS493_006623 [Desmophyllum pertusum]|uniref:Uncharacterized protein n=1 Tax=Desmophyllum pertusum TaxID=174260 RepID=A0A9X0D5P4_9CNID|nr:hypothetical protein OS493_006623 [Desmophyllum pertusum]